VAAALVRLWRSARIERAGSAYIACSFLATAEVAALALLATVSIRTYRGHWDQFDPLAFVAQGVDAWFALSIAGIIVAGPFVLAATWVGVRLRVESALYYFLTGGLTACVLVYLLFGASRQTEFGSVLEWIIGPSCGAAWGATWWILHRRWIASANRSGAHD